VAALGLPFNPGDVLPTILAGDPDSIGERLAALLVDVLEQPELHQRLTGVVRAAASEPEVARMLREFLTRELFRPAAELLGSEDGSFRANLVGSQIVGLVMARYVVAIEPLASTPPEAVAAAVAPTLQRYLLGPLGPDDR
jgi:Tetracyclin repressor-like, C-terminal domain